MANDQFCFSKKFILIAILLFFLVIFFYQINFLKSNQYSFYSRAAPQQVIGGTPAMANEFPYSVMIITKGINEQIVSTKNQSDGKYYFDLKDRFICGGTLINNHWIVTAAHCISNYPGLPLVDKQKIAIVINQTNKKILTTLNSKLNDQFYYRDIVSLKVHENYQIYFNLSSGMEPYNGSYINDIALLQINNPTNQTLSTGFPVLPSSYLSSILYKGGNQMISIGYGCNNSSLTPTVNPTTRQNQPFTISDVLNKITLPVFIWPVHITPTRALSPYPTVTPPLQTKITEGNKTFLIGYLDQSITRKKNTKTLCPGDSGSPTLYKYNNINYFVGVNVGSILFFEMPAVETRVDVFVNWINSNISPSPTPSRRLYP